MSIAHSTLNHEISLFDTVELTVPADGIGAGARGGVLELLPGGEIAMVEITEPVLEGVDRIVLVPVARLRVVA